MILKDLFEEKWWDDQDLIRLYHGTSSALLDLIHKEGLQPPVKQLDEYALEILEEYIPRDEWTDKLIDEVHQHAARISGGRAGDSGQVIFCMAAKDGPNGYATSLAEHGGEIARDVYEVACMFELRKRHPNLDDMPYQEYKQMKPPLAPRFANAHGVVLDLLVPKDWCLFYINPKQMKANIDKAHEEGKSFATPEEGQTMADVYDEIFDNREIRITRTVPPEMIVGVHAAVKESLHENVSPAFRAWFANSKVVNRDGSPKVVYHGTGQQFTAFDPESEPNNYETDRGKFFFTSDESIANEYAKNSCSLGSRPNANPRIIAAYVSLQNPYIIDNSDDPVEEWDAWGHLYGSEAADEGCDGIIIHTEDAREWLVVAFRSEQVKLITNTTFDPNSPHFHK